MTEALGLADMAGRAALLRALADALSRLRGAARGRRAG
jgi:hypothetical protein